MKKLLLAAIAATLLVAPALADSGIRRTPCGYQQVTSTAAAFNLTVPTACGTPTMATITPEAQAVRYRDDLVAPTATVGMPLAVGSTLVYEGSLANVQFIAQTSGAILDVSYYK